MSATQNLTLLRPVIAAADAPWLLLVDDQVHAVEGLADVVKRGEVQSLTWWLPEGNTSSYNLPRVTAGRQAMEPFVQAFSLQLASDAFLSVETIYPKDRALAHRVHHFEMEIALVARQAKAILALVPASAPAVAPAEAPPELDAAPAAAPELENRFPVEFAAAQAACAELGLQVTPPQGSSAHSRHMVCAAYDGVPYCLGLNDCFGKLDGAKISKSIQRRADIIRLHHPVVKAVYEHFAKMDDPVWAMCGGGLNRQVFFGHKKGYLAILYLTNEDSEFFGTREADHDGKFTLVVQLSDACKAWLTSHPLEHPQVEVRMS